MLYDTTFLLFSRMLYDVVLVWLPHATLFHSSGQIFLKKCCKVSYEMLHCLATLRLNTIKQHATMCSECYVMFYEMLYSFGRGFRALGFSKLHIKIGYVLLKHPVYLKCIGNPGLKYGLKALVNKSEKNSMHAEEKDNSMVMGYFHKVCSF